MDRWLFGGDVWDEKQTGDFLGVSIPDDKQSLKLESGHFRGMPHIRMSFQAQAESIDIFTAHFCGGVLHEGYDPFDAVDVYEPYVKTVLVMLNEVGYYSYSPDASTTVLGNRCGFPPNGIVQLRVDESNHDLYKLEFEFNPPCNRIMCSPYHGRVITQIRPRETPFSMLGIDKQNGQYLQIDNLAPGSICLDVNAAYPAPVKTWADATIQVTVNDEPFEAAKLVEFTRFDFNSGAETPYFITFYYSIVPITKTTLSPEKSSFNYCFAEVFPAGSHVVKIKVTTLSGELFTYEWKIFAR